MSNHDPLKPIRNRCKELLTVTAHYDACIDILRNLPEAGTLVKALDTQRTTMRDELAELAVIGNAMMELTATTTN